jgi:hypothetical protein
MTDGAVPRSLVPGIMLKIGLPLLIGLITLVAAEIGGMRGPHSLALAAVVTFGTALVLFIVDTEVRISAVHERLAEGLAKNARPSEASPVAGRPIVDSALLTDLVQAVSQPDERVNPLLQRLAGRELERVASFVRQLPAGREITYDGEDRDWLLGMTREAERSIDAISLSTVDAGVHGLDGGLWTSDLGIRYLELQRQAITRRVRIRRVFVFQNAAMARDETFQEITHVQRDIGVDVRQLEDDFIPDWMRTMIFVFIVFDGIVSYETRPATQPSEKKKRPGSLRTSLAQEPARVRELEEQFERLWEAADPERKID